MEQCIIESLNHITGVSKQKPTAKKDTCNMQKSEIVRYRKIDDVSSVKWGNLAQTGKK